MLTFEVFGHRLCLCHIKAQWKDLNTNGKTKNSFYKCHSLFSALLYLDLVFNVEWYH